MLYPLTGHMNENRMGLGVAYKESIIPCLLFCHQKHYINNAEMLLGYV